MHPFGDPSTQHSISSKLGSPHKNGNQQKSAENAVNVEFNINIDAQFYVRVLSIVLENHGLAFLIFKSPLSSASRMQLYSIK
jgi:hypothetical protein